MVTVQPVDGDGVSGVDLAGRARPVPQAARLGQDSQHLQEKMNAIRCVTAHLPAFTVRCAGAGREVTNDTRNLGVANAYASVCQDKVEQR
jgi:hypothetical protein